ncbi:hypothetical protein PF005_g1675 [Phytophthora fragariae]|uniref:Uncharacterized protein n=1 Tax=Phytophthora fragariae TaxID=53985 RepID=A0A6A3UVL8_9STRA|nr:hypothetical protein PF003_g35134 [Phytophthora fragariae]KAE8948723.1 hypothetical protein PF009_g1729 [Phytophthora fragariae]KAE9105906.1 hypothetical protein PF007_g13604 [Phytophthora fragariae]KAE9154616.1 hypothetical protein PF006_g1340 [Phytophthora fragariae]KAE9234978.1 hypothetical protein PF005_g1675 [Phytophthora fragariae]
MNAFHLVACTATCSANQSASIAYDCLEREKGVYAPYLAVVRPFSSCDHRGTGEAQVQSVTYQIAKLSTTD